MRKPFYFFLLFFLQSCVVKKRVESGVSGAIDRVFVIPLSVSRFVTEAASKIYTLDTLADRTKVLIKSVDIAFYTKSDSLKMNLYNVAFYFSKDSLHYEGFEVPKWNHNKYSNTMNTVVTCLYTTPNHPEVRCLTGVYSITNGRILNEEQYKLIKCGN